MGSLMLGRMLATVRELNIYPVKSARGIHLRHAQVTATGLQWDRHWMFATPQGVFISQRSHPRLARIATAIEEDALVLQTQDAGSLSLPLRPRGAAVDVRVWKSHCTGLDQGEDAATWISALLGQPLRMIRIPEIPDRLADPRYAGTDPVPVSFSDGFPILVCNSASLEDLNHRLPTPIPMIRFRPNIVLDGLPPFAEDRIARLRIGAITLELVKPCTRCIIPSLDPLTGEASTDPTPALKAFRFDKALMGVTFGENAVPTTGIGTQIRVGDSCEVELD